jgi:ring-1,2-phenylacetyl-CoA epoxidase subunit PaaE
VHLTGADKLAFHPLEVASVAPIAEDAVCITLAVPPAAREAFQFDAGQYLTVRRVIGAREERRTYSIVTAPGDRALRIGVRRQSGGRMSQTLATALRAGELLEAARPAGRFRTAVDPARARCYVAFAAGSGITPVLSLATDILAREPNSRFTLIYGNRSMARTMFLEDILALKNRHMHRFAVHFVMSREPQQTPLLNGRIDGAKVRELAGRLFEPSAVDEYFLCGPGSMVDDLRRALKSLSADAVVRSERFAGAAAPVRGPQTAAEAPPQAQPLATITVTIDGRRRSFPMAHGNASVLEAGEKAGLELPFSCRSGICATCRARVVAGDAVMTHNIALQDWELAAGFILCCQARPTGATLELSYDEK